MDAVTQENADLTPVKVMLCPGCGRVRYGNEPCWACGDRSG